MITAILKRDILDVKENFLISHELEHFASLLEKEMATHSVFLPEESQGWGNLVGCGLWGRTESDTTKAT